MAGMGYFRDRIALLDKGSQEFLTVLVALGGYCTVSQAEAQFCPSLRSAPR